ncbi:MAG: enoyl-CoA hydratase/isomerase family protein [Nocardiaceae bacterium]|nr:enoyl-CoA hydratase/isomerase family protein [Nocardiaceae bacterium]
MPYLRREGQVFVLDLGEAGQPETDNRLSPDALDAIEACIDEAEASQGPAALVTTATGKFFSNGFVPELFAPDGSYLLRAQQVFARVVASELPTIAAVNGHAFGGAAFLAVAHDIRLMRTDRGFFCLPELDLGMLIPNGFDALFAARVPQPGRHIAVVTARRFGGADAVQAGIMDQALSAEELLPTALALGEQLAAKRGPNLAATKKHMYGTVLDEMSRYGLPAQ